jgi:hypothetical protein
MFRFLKTTLDFSRFNPMFYLQRMQMFFYQFPVDILECFLEININFKAKGFLNTQLLDIVLDSADPRIKNSLQQSKVQYRNELVKQVIIRSDVNCLHNLTINRLLTFKKYVWIKELLDHGYNLRYKIGLIKFDERTELLDALTKLIPKNFRSVSKIRSKLITDHFRFLRTFVFGFKDAPFYRIYNKSLTCIDLGLVHSKPEIIELIQLIKYLNPIIFKENSFMIFIYGFLINQGVLTIRNVNPSSSTRFLSILGKLNPSSQVILVNRLFGVSHNYPIFEYDKKEFMAMTKYFMKKIPARIL